MSATKPWQPLVPLAQQQLQNNQVAQTVHGKACGCKATKIQNNVCLGVGGAPHLQQCSRASDPSPRDRTPLACPHQKLCMTPQNESSDPRYCIGQYAVNASELPVNMQSIYVVYWPFYTCASSVSSYGRSLLRVSLLLSLLDLNALTEFRGLWIQSPFHSKSQRRAPCDVCLP